MTIVVQNVVSKCGCVFDSPLFENNFPRPAVRATQSHRGKRMRTLASQLLGGSDDERPPHDDTPLDRKDEISKLKKRIQDLDLQLSSLKEKNAGLRGKLAQVSLQLLDAQKFSIAIGGEPGVRAFPGQLLLGWMTTLTFWICPGWMVFCGSWKGHNCVAMRKFVSNYANKMKTLLLAFFGIAIGSSVVCFGKNLLCTKLGSLKTSSTDGMGNCTAIKRTLMMIGSN